jgi:glyoxylase-like metal-dependent hydrolase (beta-lactamase superfamily II)
MRVQELATGLWRWTGRHPAWTPAEGGPDGWDQEVGSYYYEGPDSIVLFDPLVPMEDRDRFFEALDRDVARVARPVRVLLTVEDHRRSSAELAERYGGRVGEVPAGVEVALEAWEERAYWIPEHAALVFGDLVLARDGGLELPRTWIGDERYDEVREGLRPLLELPVERMLVTHGEPVLEGGRDALARALLQ